MGRPNTDVTLALEPPAGRPCGGIRVEQVLRCRIPSPFWARDPLLHSRSLFWRQRRVARGRLPKFNVTDAAQPEVSCEVASDLRALVQSSYDGFMNHNVPSGYRIVRRVDADQLKIGHR